MFSAILMLCRFSDQEPQAPQAEMAGQRKARGGRKEREKRERLAVRTAAAPPPPPPSPPAGELEQVASPVPGAFAGETRTILECTLTRAECALHWLLN